MEIRALANLARFREIVVVLVKYGFDDLVSRLDLPTLPFRLRVERADPGMTTGERIRCALQELGPTFIKFGQSLSLRPDVLPQSLIVELSKLQDQVAPVPFDQIRAVIEKELGRSLEAAFSLFDETPEAAASLAQVHRGVLSETGQVVAVKVQRPRIPAIIETDLNILEAIANRVHHHYADLQVYNLPSLVALTRRTLRRELDFRREARHMKIAQANLAAMTNAVVPTPLPDYTTKRLLVMDYVQGRKLSELTTDELNLDFEALARTGLQVTLCQVLEHGFFHADPHPGNLMVLAGNRLALLDWGMVGRLTPEEREALLDLVRAIVDRDSRHFTDALLQLTRAEAELNRQDLERDLMDILDLYTAIPLKEVSLGQLLLDVGAIFRDHRLRMPPNLFLMVKALAASEQVGRSLYPELNVVAEAEPFVRRLTRERYSPRTLLHHAWDVANVFLRFNRTVPGQVTGILHKLQRGELTLRFEHENLEGLRTSVTDASQRLTLAVIIGSMIIGSSMIITTGKGPQLFGYPALGVIGFLMSGVIGLWLVFTIIRSARRK